MTAGARAGRRPAKVAALVALSLVPITGMAALVFDLGLLRDDRRRAVVAADAAALAAATDLFNNWNTYSGEDKDGTAVKSAKTTAAANGFTDGSGGVTVTVNVYPSNFQQGPHSGTQIPKGTAEVIISFQQERYFGSIWGSQKLTGGARAVARGTYSPASPGILVLDPTDNNTFNLTSSGNVTVNNGGSIVIDSSSSSGASLTNTGNGVATTINITGKAYSASNAGTLQGTINYNVPATPDPLAALPEPSQPALPSTPTIGGVAMTSGQGYSTSQGLNYSGTQTIDLYPGYYAGIKLSSSGSVVLHDNADGSPGIYYIGSQGLSISNSGGISGDNVMIYTDGTGSISLTGTGSMTLTPPTSGTYQGITIFQERTSTKQISITGSGNMNVAGTLYAAKAKVTLTAQGNYTNNLGSQWVAYQLVVTGSGNFTVDYSGTATPIRSIQLVE
jgi:hypothetical protein